LQDYFIFVVKNHKLTYMPYGKIQANLNEVTRDTIVAYINQLFVLMPFLVLITAKEKNKGLRLGKKTGVLFSRADSLVPNNLNIIPPTFSPSDMHSSIIDWQFLSDILVQLKRVLDAVACTQIALEQQTMKDCLYFYKLAQNAAKQNIPGAAELVEELEPLMPRSGKKLVKKVKK
jgi:hypothetical protein